jgi:hypothetical protein
MDIANPNPNPNPNPKLLLTINLEDFSKYYLYFSNKIKNKIMKGTFSKIKYSTPLFELNMIYINIPLFFLQQLNQISIDKNNFVICEKMKSIEKDILDYYCYYFSINKVAKYKLFNNMTLNSQKIQKNKNDANNKNELLLLKITGIWENDFEFGLIYKFYHYHN